MRFGGSQWDPRGTGGPGGNDGYRGVSRGFLVASGTVIRGFQGRSRGFKGRFRRVPGDVGGVSRGPRGFHGVPCGDKVFSWGFMGVPRHQGITGLSQGVPERAPEGLRGV